MLRTQHIVWLLIMYPDPTNSAIVPYMKYMNMNHASCWLNLMYWVWPSKTFESLCKPRRSRGSFANRRGRRLVLAGGLDNPINSSTGFMRNIADKGIKWHVVVIMFYNVLQTWWINWKPAGNWLSPVSTKQHGLRFSTSNHCSKLCARFVRSTN